MKFLNYLIFLLLVSTKLAANTLPSDIKWLTNDTSPEFADLTAKRGGTFNSFISSFPATMRLHGPESNGSFASVLRELQLNLLGMHPNDDSIIPQLATHWAYGDDGKTMYFKLNPLATWSDEKPVTADDFVLSMEFGLSKVITDPFANDYWTNELRKVTKIDDNTISVETVNKKPKSDLHFYCNISPTPKHFFGGRLPNEYVKAFNWKIAPSTAAYEISNLNKGKSIALKRRKKWFLDNERFYRGRFNAEAIQYDVIRDINVAWEMFKKGKIDNFAVLNPTYWHDKSNDAAFHNGYIHKLWFYTDQPQSAAGLWLNEMHPLLSDQNVRLGLAHAINVDEVIKKLLRNEYERLDHHFVGYGKYSDESIKARKFDIALAESYFKKAGWHKRGEDGILTKEGQRLSFTLTYGAEILNGRLAFIKEEAKKAGVELKLQLMDGEAAFKLMREKKHEISYSAWTTSPRPEFHQHYASELAGKTQNNNITNTSDPEIDSLITQYRQASDESQRITLSKKLQNLVHNKANFIPTFSLPFYRDAYWRWLRLPKLPGMKLADSSFDPITSSMGGIFWIDEAMRKETLDGIKSGGKFPVVTVIDKTYKKK
jgi:microcin C transport system substrate-binding protein